MDHLDPKFSVNIQQIDGLWIDRIDRVEVRDGLAQAPDRREESP